jgi:hypothetical protein
VARTREVGAAAGASVLVVVTSCRDPALHRARIDGRSRDIPGWPELTWDNVSRFLDRWEPPADVDLRLDATDPVEANVGTLRAQLAKVGVAGP